MDPYSSDVADPYSSNEADSYSSDKADGRNINNAGSGGEDTDLFVNSTISRDETQSKDSKEKGMLESLAGRLNSSVLPLNSPGAGKGMQLANHAGRSEPHPTGLEHLHRSEYIAPPFGMIPTRPFHTPPTDLHGPMPQTLIPRVRANGEAQWRQKMLQRTGDIGVDGSKEAQTSTSGSQGATGEYKNGTRKSFSIARDSEQTQSGETIQPPGGRCEGNAGQKASGSPSDKPLTSDLSLSESLGFVAERHFGLNFFDQSSDVAQFSGFLLDTIELLERQVHYLRAVDDYSSASESEPEEEQKPEEVLPRAQILHQVFCPSSLHDHHGMIYEDEPTYSTNRPSGRKILTGRSAVPNVDRFCAHYPSVCFIVFKEYSCSGEVGERRSRFSKSTVSERLERLRIVSPILRKALEKVARFGLYDDVENGSQAEMYAPYNFLFHHRKDIASLSKESDEYRPVLSPLLDFLDKSYEKEYGSAEALFQRGMVSGRHFGKLFRPNQVVVSKPQGAESLRAFVLDKAPRPEGKLRKIDFEGWSWQYDGVKLLREACDATIDALPDDDEVVIKDLDLHPVDFAQQSDIKELEDRGKMFWDHTAQVFVSYTGWDQNNDHYYVDARFMVDVRTYQKMHPESAPYPYHRSHTLRFDTWPVTIHRQETLSKELLMLLPRTTYGFNMQQKKWVGLKVSLLQPVTWNTMSFERLVLDENIKQMIRALVDVQTSADKMDDIITGKGNGLIVLLHGSPGTGKTLTAESVAEIAKKPLYRVTCGDIGTQPQEVEKYLQTVLYLGQIWDCVLLLDEADVFLEERTMADLQRNSLVSVFLRVLEYCEGILILTSNRVGTFDEAFKSRIQVAIHYDNLTKRSRKQIWTNFFEMLEDANEDANIPEFERRLDTLAAEEMNGRQIRNALLTARQLAKHRKERLDWEHLSQAMKTSSAFNKYLKAVKGHSDDEWAREGMLR